MACDIPSMLWHTEGSVTTTDDELSTVRQCASQAPKPLNLSTWLKGQLPWL